MTQPEAARVERGPITEVKRFALGMADLLERQGFTIAAAEMRRLHAENEALRKTLAASCDEERQQLWEAGPGGGCSRALSAEFQRDALLEALQDLCDEQEGPPLVRRHRQWQAAIDKVRAAIKAAEEHT